MPHPPASLFAAVHPHQIEVQDFDSYALIVDARAPSAFAVDHIPGAINVPLDTEVRDALTASPGDLPAPLSTWVAPLRSADAILVYCDRGGLDAQAYAEPLRRCGFEVDVLAGGWGNYRRWVAAGLEVLPRMLTLRRLVAPPVSGLCKVLAVLRDQGEQVLDVSDLSGQRLLPGLTLAGDPLPSQDAFDTLLLDAMRRFDPERVVWLRYGPAPLRGLTLPGALNDRLDRCECVRVAVPCDARVRMWLERIQSMHTPLPRLLGSIREASAPAMHCRFDQWLALVEAGRPEEALLGVIDDCIDPAHAVPQPSADSWVLEMTSLETTQVVPAVREWLRAHPAPSLAGQ
jgi:tRNA 2-selenouridine synthase